MIVCMMIMASLSMSYWAAEHDIPLAMYTIVETDESTDLHITLDVADYCTETGANHSEVGLQAVHTYLRQHLSIVVNDQPRSYDLTDMEVRGDHLQVHGSLTGKPSLGIEHIAVTNTVLLTIPHHSNIMQFEVNNERRDYRMHKGRQAIDVKY